MRPLHAKAIVTSSGVTAVTFLNATADTVIGTITDGATYTLASLPATISFRAETQGTIGSIKFGYDPTAGSFNANYHTESLAPYTLLGENNNGKDFIGGIPPAHAGSTMPPHWLMYIMVADVAATATYWEELGYTNRWRMFDLLRNTGATSPSPVVVDITRASASTRPGTRA